MPRLLNDEEIERALTELPGWSRDGDAVVARHTAPDFLTGIRVVVEVARAAETMDHHPDIDIRWRTLSWRLSTHSEGGVTQLDIDLAQQISQAAADIGAHPGD